MKDAILQILADSQRVGLDGTAPPLDEEVLRQLEALGYLGAPVDRSLQSVWRGMAVWGHEVRELIPCGESEALWIVDESGDFRDRYEEAARGLEPYSPIYMEVEARSEPTPSEGFGAEYGGALRITEVLVASSEGGSDCPDS